jgi:cardiolipin synthase A/B
VIGSRAPTRRFARLKHAFFGERRPGRLCFTVGNTVRLYKSGVAFFPALIGRIDAAEREISLETYIFNDDAAGRPVSDALMNAARRGVRVRVITDGIGTDRLPMFDEWLTAGVEHRIYNPHLFGQLGFSRTHRKLAVIDHLHAFCGGINIVDDFEQSGARLEHARWDFTLEAEGPVVNDVREAFDLQWTRIRLGIKPRPARSSCDDPQSQQNADGGSPGRFRRNARTRLRARRGQIHAVDKPCVAFVARDNLVNRRAIEKAYLSAISNARTEVMLANPYFMPGRKLRRALMEAARRGVRVTLVIGRKEFVALDYATPFLYANLLKNGVRIAEYEKTILHGKVAVVDSNWATVGSSNLDALSLVLNNEANMVLVNHENEIVKLRDAILAAFHDGHPITAEHYAARPIGERVLNWLAYNAYRTMMKMLTIGRYD